MNYDKNTLQDVAQNDIEQVWKKDIEYGRSWMVRGGVGAFMMLARKWDRIENQLKRADAPFSMDGGRPPGRYDIFEHIEADTRPEGVLDDIRDLRRYLLLVEAQMVANGVVKLPQRPILHSKVQPVKMAQPQALAAVAKRACSPASKT